MNESCRRLLVLCGVFALSTVLRAAETTAAADDAAKHCQSLSSEDFSQIQDATSQVTDAKLIAADGDVPAYCELRGYVIPNIGIELKLPVANWNGKFLEMGCGGYCGVFFSSYSENVGHDCDDGLRRGYACIASDQGHQGTMMDAKWAYHNLQAQIDYVWRGPHVAALAGKAITERYYGKSPTKSYFWGCSGGGREALVEAQKFPWDFDGIVSVAPGMDFASIFVGRLWNIRAAAPEGKPLFTENDVKWLHEAVVAKCDNGEGVKDGVIGNPLGCRLNFSEWACGPGKTERCLSGAQVKALDQIYEGPTDSKGRKIGVLPPVPGLEIYVPTTTQLDELASDYFKYIAFLDPPGPKWKPQDFNFDTDYRRTDYSQAFYLAADPDLTPLKEAGGKLILVHGAVDSALTPLLSVAYYEKAERTMGGRAETADFFRFFLVPGMDHCSGGPGAYAIDYLKAIEDWSEKGKAPAELIGAHIKDGFYKGWDFKMPADPATVTYTRPVYPYPLHAKYTGTGDPNDAENFEAVQ